ncbi:MAG: hypothetical protein AAF587_43380 [Bacteroidota bacterium]
MKSHRTFPKYLPLYCLTAYLMVSVQACESCTCNIPQPTINDMIIWFVDEAGERITKRYEKDKVEVWFKEEDGKKTLHETVPIGQFIIVHLPNDCRSYRLPVSLLVNDTLTIDLEIDMLRYIPEDDCCAETCTGNSMETIFYQGEILESKPPGQSHSAVYLEIPITD